MFFQETKLAYWIATNMIWKKRSKRDTKFCYWSNKNIFSTRCPYGFTYCSKPNEYLADRGFHWRLHDGEPSHIVGHCFLLFIVFKGATRFRSSSALTVDKDEGHVKPMKYCWQGEKKIETSDHLQGSLWSTYPNALA